MVLQYIVLNWVGIVFILAVLMLGSAGLNYFLFYSSNILSGKEISFTKF